MAKWGAFSLQQSALWVGYIPLGGCNLPYALVGLQDIVLSRGEDDGLVVLYGVAMDRLKKCDRGQTKLS